MPAYTFHQLDVFTTTPLTGNPLAVFPDARGLAPATMQALAREMNLSETTFVFPSTAATRQVRFFTPAAEIPLAGHPTIGTWWLLAELGLLDGLPSDGPATCTQDTGRGVLPIAITLAGGRPTRVEMTQASPEWGPVVKDQAVLARAVGGDAQLIPEAPRPQVVSTALPQLMAPVQSREALAALPTGGTGSDLAGFLRALGTDCAMLYAPADSPDLTAHCRMFAPGLGVPEDPATGSAAGALGAYLVRYGVVAPRDGEARMTFEQGIEIGRPSRIDVRVLTDDSGTITSVRVGGAAVRVISGEVHL